MTVVDLDAAYLHNRYLKLGYRQREILLLLHASRNGSLPTGYLKRKLATDNRTVHKALNGLRDRGLVKHVCHGVWELV